MDQDVIHLFHELADRSPAEREAYYAAQLVPAAVRIEVESLLGFDRTSACSLSGYVASAAEEVLADVQYDPHMPSLRSGSHLGSYEILIALGAGGMGQVYRAHDPRLKRDIALKVLPPEMISVTERRQRFEREAQAIAALNHPNIVTIYSVEEAEGLPFLTMELIDGKPLLDVLPPAGLPLDTFIALSIPLADAIGAAHQRGITHRDLKPANIMVTIDRRVKVLDFGVAKLRESPAADLSTLPTQGLTGSGRIIGTVAYMSPEQAEGKVVDERSDIFSLGIVLYEMATGERPFKGATAVSTISAIIKDTPVPVTDLNRTLPRDLARIIRRALAKDPERRYQTAKDVRNDLEELKQALASGAFALAAMSESGSKSESTHDLAGPRPWRRRALTAAAVIVLAAIVASGLWIFLPAAQEPTWSGVLLGGPEMALDPRISPDGHLLAFEAFDRGMTQVAVMKPETGNWSILTHNRDRGAVMTITWSPDGASVYYDRYTDVPQGIYSVPVLGGEEKLIVENATSPEALPDGSLLLQRLNARRQVQLFRFWPETGRLQDLPIISPSFIDSALCVVRASADGKQVLAYGAVSGRETEGRRLVSLDLATGSSRPLSREPEPNVGLWGWAVSHDGRSFLTAVQAGALTRVVSTPTSGGSAGHTLFTVTNRVWYMDAASDSSVYVALVDQPVEIVRRSLNGDRTEKVAGFPEVAGSDIIAVLPDGRAVVTLPASGGHRLMAVEQGKDPVSLITTAEDTSAPATLVGQRQIAFVIGPAPHQTIALADTSTGLIAGRISPGKGAIGSLVSSTDGRTLYFAAGRTIWSIPAVGGEARLVRAGDSAVMDPDGRSLVVSLEESSKLRLFRVFLDGRAEREIIPDGSVPMMNWPLSPGALSADGRLLVPLMDSWFNHPATLDTATGRITRLPSDDISDYHSMAWLPGGQIMALHVGLRATLWKFQPAVPASR